MTWRKENVYDFSAGRRQELYQVAFQQALRGLDVKDIFISFHDLYGNTKPKSVHHLKTTIDCEDDDQLDLLVWDLTLRLTEAKNQRCDIAVLKVWYDNGEGKLVPFFP